MCVIFTGSYAFARGTVEACVGGSTLDRGWDGMKNFERSGRLGEPGAAEDIPWVGFLALGVGLVLCGIAAMLLPAYSNIATSTGLGIVLAVAGVLTVWHAFRSTTWGGFSFELLAGAAETVGGILIVLNPLKGAAAVTLLVAIVIGAQGIAQLALAWRIRPQPGWTWLAGASLLSLLVVLALLLRFPFDLIEQPGAMAGLALLAAGVAYVVMALGRRQAGAGA
jgi:uncharacterized membrane protein HdeD (DUF308 family)